MGATVLLETGPTCHVARRHGQLRPDSCCEFSELRKPSSDLSFLYPAPRAVKVMSMCRPAEFGQISADVSQFSANVIQILANVGRTDQRRPRSAESCPMLANLGEMLTKVGQS